MHEGFYRSLLIIEIIVTVETLSIATLPWYWFVVAFVHITALLHLAWLPTIFLLQWRNILLLQILLFNKFLLSFLKLLHSCLFKRLFRHDINRLAYVDLFEHSDCSVFGKHEWVWTDLWFYALRCVLAWIWTLWTFLHIVPSPELWALCLRIMTVIRLVVFLPYYRRIWWKSTAFYFKFFILKCFCLIYLRPEPFIIFIRFLLLLKVTFCA